MIPTANSALKAWLTATFDTMEKLGAFRAPPPTGYAAALQKQKDGQNDKE